MSKAPNRRAMWPPKGPCHLCSTDGPRRRSHIVPKFVGDWLRATNVTGRLRDTEAPNRLVEDLPWRHMLCSVCEQRFGQFEAEVCERIFLPLHERQQERFRYGLAFVQFAVSVLWRTLVLLQVEGRLGGLGELSEIVSTERVWRQFLLGQVQSLAPHEVHAFHLDAPPPDANLRDLPPNLGRYMRRSVGFVTLQRDDFGYLFVKMARINIFGTVVAGSQRKLWRNSKLHVSGGSWGGGDVVTPDWVPSIFMDGAELGEATFEGLSSQQKGRTNARLLAAARADGAAVRDADSTKAMRTDVNRVGKRAFQKPFN